MCAWHAKAKIAAPMSCFKNSWSRILTRLTKYCLVNGSYASGFLLFHGGITHWFCLFCSTSNHRWGTLVSWSAWFAWDLTSSTSTVSSYSTTSSLIVLSHCLISISVGLSRSRHHHCSTLLPLVRQKNHLALYLTTTVCLSHFQMNYYILRLPRWLICAVDGGLLYAVGFH